MNPPRSTHEAEPATMSQTLQHLHQTLREQLLPVTVSPAQAAAEADLILEGVLQIDPAAVYVDGHQELSDQQYHLVQQFLEQRVHKRIPVQYLLHQAYFYGLRFYVNPHVLIPRPETELLVEKALDFLKPGMNVLDVGTGPGTIAIAISRKAGQEARVVATDISATALKVAKLNQKNLKTHVEFCPAGDLFEPVGRERFNLIVSNPPYIDVTLKPTLSPEVLWHEPESALFPPTEDAYYFYRRLAQEAKTHLKPGGRLLVECGAGMTPSICQLFTVAGYHNIEVIRDYAELDRIVSADA